MEQELLLIVLLVSLAQDVTHECSRPIAVACSLFFQTSVRSLFIMLLKRSLLPFLIGVGLIGCNPSSYLGFALPNPPLTPIADLKPQTGNVIVYLKGKVGDRAPFLGSSAYQLQDSTGTIWIRTNQPPPKKGEEIVIRAQVEYQAIQVGNQALGEVYVVELEKFAPQIAQAPSPTPQPQAQSTASPSPKPVANQPSPSPQPSVKPSTPQPPKPVANQPPTPPQPSVKPTVPQPSKPIANQPPTPAKTPAKPKPEPAFMPHKRHE